MPDIFAGGLKFNEQRVDGIRHLRIRVELMPFFRRVGVGPSYSWSFSEGWSRLKAEVEVSNDRVMIRMASAQL